MFHKEKVISWLVIFTLILTLFLLKLSNEKQDVDYNEFVISLLNDLPTEEQKEVILHVVKNYLEFNENPVLMKYILQEIKNN